MTLRRDKVLGGLIGGAIGDAWGSPVEMFSPEQIRKVHPGGLVHYVEPVCHKFFSPEILPPGTITDDTQTTLATLIGVIAGRCFDMDAIARAHVVCLKSGTLGFGKSTLEALQRLAEGNHWNFTGRTSEPGRGFGNGIPMKCFPLAALHLAQPDENVFNDKMVDFAAMTHYTKMAALSGVVHTLALEMCLSNDVDDFDTESFLYAVSHLAFDWAKDPLSPAHFDISRLEDSTDDLQKPLLDLWEHRQEIPYWTTEEIRKRYGKGSPYVYNTLPFCYAFFCQNPYSFDTGRTVIEAGGDTDTNGKIVLEMIGSLHGLDLFFRDENRWSIEGLRCYAEVMKLGKLFCDGFKVDG